jgi:8-oxo-dGTP diphosphatase
MRVVAAVITRGALILACRRANHKSLAGFWEFPGGKVEGDESDHQALARELKEELGVEVVIGEFICKTSSDTSGIEIEMFTYFCELTSPPPTSSSDHDKLVWVSRENLADFEWPKLDVPVVEALLASQD